MLIFPFTGVARIFSTGALPGMVSFEDNKGSGVWVGVKLPSQKMF